MDKNEYKKKIQALTVKHIVFPSGLEVDVKVPAATEMIDALIKAGFDIQKLFARTEELKRKAQQAQERGQFFFDTDVYRMSEVLAGLIRDTDGEPVAEYVKYIPEDYKTLEEEAVSFFMVTPSLKSTEGQQNSSESDTNEQGSGRTNSSESTQSNGTLTSQS